MRLWLLLSLCLGSQAASIQINPGCQTGYTGTNCNNPICASQGPLTKHDGTFNYGDTIARFDSQTCGETFEFPVDNFLMETLYVFVTIDKDNNFPTATIFDPSGFEHQASGQQYLGTRQGRVYFDLRTAARGLYTLKIQSQAEGECIILVSAQTTLTVDGGFVQDPRDDYVQEFNVADNQGIARYPSMGSSSYLAFKVQNEDYPTIAQNVRIFNDRAGYSLNYNVVARYNCTFPHTSLGAFNCNETGQYHAEFSGIDNGGNTWKRLYDFVCDASAVTQLPPTGTPTTPPVETECLNNGILTQNGTCYCGEYYDGTECEWKLCMNGGTLQVRTEECLCPVGWTGDNCQHVACKTRSQDKFYRVQKALGFVVRSASSMAAQISQIAQAAETIAGNYPFIQVYVLSVIQNGQVLFTNTYDNPKGFINGIKGISTPPVDTVCSDALLLGVSSIMEQEEFQQYPNSPIFVFSDGVLNDGYAVAGMTLQQMGIQRPILYFMLSDSVSGQCNIDLSSEGYDTLLGFSGFSQGLVIKNDITKLAHTTQMLVDTLFDTNVISQNDLLDCRQAPMYQPFFVDDSMTDVWIFGVGDNLTLTITYPDQTTKTPLIYFFSGNLNIWLVSNAPTGAYMINMRSGNPGATECSYRVTATSTFNLFLGATTDVLTDEFNKQPVVNQDSHLVAKFNNIFLPDPIDVSAEITLWVNDINSGRVVLYSSSGIWRDGCAYELYFGSFKCTVPGMGFYASIYVTDNQDLTVLRTITGYCSASLPPSPGETCQNGGATFNGTCICPSHFTGDRCETIHCENQGTPKFGACACPPNFAGQFCEVYGCSQTSNVVFETDYRSLTFLMHDSITMRSVFRTINDAAPRIVHDIVQQHPKWLLNYQLIRFNDTFHESLSDSPNPQDFINAINNAYQINMGHSDYSCQGLDLYKTIYAALTDEGLYFNGILYIFVYGMPRADLDSYDKIITHIEDSGVQINVVQFSMNPCGGDYTQDGLMSLAQASGGTYFLSSGPNAGNIMKSLPSVHSSGLMYERFVDNCADQTFYVPVDANTQAVTAYIQGEMVKDPIYTKPDQTIADINAVSNIWNDIGMDSRMDQLIQACDPGWQLSDGHCFYFYGQTANWTAAQAKCSQFGASLATVYSAAEQKWLNYAGYQSKFWIGLNNLVNLDQWVWALPNGGNITLDSTRYTNWAPGQPVKDIGKRCVLDDNFSGTNWAATDCSESHYFACSKDTYNTEFEAGDNSQKNYVQRGTWAIRVQADGPCSIQLRAQSTLQIYPLYTTNVHNDFGFTVPVQGIKSNRMIAHVTGLAEGTTHSLEYGHVYSDDGRLLQANTIAHRDSNTCTFDYISTTWECINGGFQMMMTGVDSFGYAYQRVIPVLCLSQRVDSCENGGVVYEGVCACPPQYIGERCEIALCLNGGFNLGSMGACHCPDDYQGQFCELPRCTRGGIVPDISTDGKTFVLAIDGSSTGDMANVLTNINNTLVTMFSGITNGWFTSYVAVVFRDSKEPNGNIFSNTITDTDYVSWAGKIDAELKAHPYQSTQTSRAIFSGLAQALSSPLIKTNSFAYVLTNSKAEDTRNEDQVLAATARTHTSISFIFIGDTTAPGGGNDYTDPAVADLYEAAHNSGGGAYQLNTAGTLSDQWQKIVLSYHNSYTIISHHVANCSAYTDYIQLGSNGTELIVDVAQGDPDVKVINAAGDIVNPLNLFTSKTNLLTEFHQLGQNPGIWSVTMKGSSAACVFTVRGQSGVTVFAAFTQDVEKDGGKHDGSAGAFPVANSLANAVVATVNSGSLTFVQMLDIEEHGVIWASSLVPRALCAYNYISDQTFVCDRPSFLLAIDGLDAIGHPFRRLMTYHCQGYIPPATSPKPTTSPTPPPTTVTPYPLTDPAAAKVDLIVVMDSSDSFTGYTFGLANVPFRELFQQMNFTNSRLLLGAYDQTANFLNATLADITNQTTMIEHDIDLSLMAYTGLQGNNIDDVLFNINATLDVAPFRDGVRKIVVFISSLGWDKGNAVNGIDQGYADPAANIVLLKQMNVEFIPIAYGPNANMDQLKAFSTKCIQTAENPVDFDLIAKYVQWNIGQTAVQC